MAVSEKLLEVAHGLALKGQILAEVGDAATCLIATGLILYVGRKDVGRSPINLTPYAWTDVAGVSSKEGWFTVDVTLAFNKPVVDLAKKVAQGAVLFGVIGALAAAAGPNNELSFRFSKDLNEVISRFIETARSLIANASGMEGGHESEAAGSLPAQLERLASLHSKVTLTDEEYTAAKRRVLDKE